MCSRLFPHLNRRKFLKLGEIKRTAVKSKRLKKKAVVRKLQITQPKVTLCEEPKLMSKLVKTSSKVSRKVNSDIDDNHIQDVKHSLHEAKERIESVLLSRLHCLLSPSLSKNATRRLLKKTALEIAANLGVPRKKFKGTNKWLNAFLKHNKLLGCSVCVKADSDVHVKENQRPRRHGLENKNWTTSRDVDVLGPIEDIPDLNNLFTLSGACDASVIAENVDATKVQSQIEGTIKPGKRSASTQPDLCICKQTVSSNEILSQKDSYQWIGASLFSKNCLLEKSECYLQRSNKNKLQDDTYSEKSEACSLYDELFFASQRLRDCDINNFSCSTSLPSDDSGYRSLSENKNTEVKVEYCPTNHFTTLQCDLQPNTNFAKTSSSKQMRIYLNEDTNTSTVHHSLPTNSIHSISEKSSDSSLISTSNNLSKRSANEMMDISDDAFNLSINLFEDPHGAEEQSHEMIPANVDQSEIDFSALDFSADPVELLCPSDDATQFTLSEEDNDLIKELFS